MRLRLDLDAQLTDRLIREAVADRRPVPWQAEILLRRAVGLPDRSAAPPEPQVSPQDGGGSC
jgi:hypothetical protein